jgi:hypothetical protein
MWASPDLVFTLSSNQSSGRRRLTGLSNALVAHSKFATNHRTKAGVATDALTATKSSELKVNTNFSEGFGFLAPNS